MGAVTIVTDSVPIAVASACETASIVTFALEGTLAGPVKLPDVSMVP